LKDTVFLNGNDCQDINLTKIFTFLNQA